MYAVFFSSISFTQRGLWGLANCISNYNALQEAIMISHTKKKKKKFLQEGLLHYIL